ncbi:tripartite tricarboxylate transporter substrate binding protein [Candidimonas humi]|uniref:Bug family tripartite tricarboxylate transporter substrate binding protein n=1 Tax=Candidimonas humi TaxID=683355 RepID=A0ABV8P2V0_9BURK|nr:tripartite tricarboxylate transporter substrate binding protein [Candidimonas humi]MBV6306637.1 tripartite tricarboxylate transporter substrate binding protein [Candidimonas humi]
MKTLHRIAAALGMAASTLMAANASAAETYPDHPITLIVPWNAGGAIDVTGRKLAELLGKDGLTVVVENVAGASSLIGLGRVAHSKPDGYTLGLATPSLMGAIALKTTQLTQADFVALNKVGVDPLMLVVPKSSPANSVEDFVKLMKTKPAGVSIGIPGANNVNQIFASSLAKAANVDYTDVPYTGGSKVLMDVAGGQIDAGVVKPSESIGQIKSGLVKPIGVFAHQRIDALPDVPTFEEHHVNVFPYGDMEQVTYLVAPAGVPQDRLAKMEELVSKAVNSDAYKRFTHDHGMSISDVHGAAMQKEAEGIQHTFDTVAPKIFKVK